MCILIYLIYDHHQTIIKNMTSSLLIKNRKIDKYGDFSSDFDYNSKTDVFRDVIYLIINQREPRRPLGTFSPATLDCIERIDCVKIRLLTVTIFPA